MKNLYTLFVIFVFTASAIAVPGQKISAVSLDVQIDDAVSQGIYGIGSDGQGLYSHGISSVKAQFTSSGFLDFVSGSRLVNAHYSTPVELTQNPLVASDSASGVSIKTHSGSNTLQTMAVGSTRCVQTTVNFTIGSYTRTIGYNAGYGTISNTGRVLVSHPDVNTWIMQSDSGGACLSADTNSYDNVVRVRDHKSGGKPAPDVDYGRFYMPLRIVLTRR